MIELTRLNGNPLAVNSDLIQFAESSPDTVLTMVSGEKLIVSEDLREVADRMIAYRARIMAEAARLCPEGPAATAGLDAVACSNAAVEPQGAAAKDESSAAMMRRRRRLEF